MCGVGDSDSETCRAPPSATTTTSRVKVRSGPPWCTLHASTTNNRWYSYLSLGVTLSVFHRGPDMAELAAIEAGAGLASSIIAFIDFSIEFAKLVKDVADAQGRLP